MHTLSKKWIAFGGFLTIAVVLAFAGVKGELSFAASGSCGDGHVDTPNADNVTEFCDDGNCNSTCTACNPEATLVNGVCTVLCGNGALDAGEVCDITIDQSGLCNNTCSACNDGSTPVEGRCEPAAAPETPPVHETPPQETPTPVPTVCGDGHVDTPNAAGVNEFCDGIGCNETCTACAAGFQMSGSGVCGMPAVDQLPPADNTTSPTCNPNETLVNGVCVELCGNGALNAGEVCDISLDKDGYCNNTCTACTGGSAPANGGCVMPTNDNGNTGGSTTDQGNNGGGSTTTPLSGTARLQLALDKPAAGATVPDPVFGTAITRLTDGAANKGIVPNYSKRQAWNADGTLMMLQNTDGVFKLYNGKPPYAFVRDLPASITGAQDIFWNPRAASEVLYNHADDNGHVLLTAFDVTSDHERTVFDFGAAYTSAHTHAEGNLSMDGNRYGVLTEKQDGSREFVVADISQADSTQNHILALLNLPNNPANCDSVDVANCPSGNVDWVSISPNGNYFVADYSDQVDANFHGMEVYDVSGGTFSRVWHKPLGAGHSDLGVDDSGQNMVLVDITPFDANGDQIHQIAKYTLPSGQQTILLTISPEFDLHMSCRNFSRPGWCVISTFDYVGRLQDTMDNASIAWLPYEDEVFALKTDGSQTTTRLAHHRSRRFSTAAPDPDQSEYYAEPHATVDPTGTKVLFASNWRQDVRNPLSLDTYLVPWAPDGTTPPPPAAVCGNKIMETGEQCDDGNVVTGDGCDAKCQKEPVAAPAGLPIYLQTGTALFSNAFDFISNATSNTHNIVWSLAPDNNSTLAYPPFIPGEPPQLGACGTNCTSMYFDQSALQSPLPGPVTLTLEKTVTPPGTLTVSSLGQDIEPRNLVGKSTGQLVSRYQFDAKDEAFTVNKFTVMNDAVGAFDTAVSTGVISSVKITYPDMKGDIQTKTGSLSATGTATFSDLGMVVPKNDKAILEIRVDVMDPAEIPQAFSGQTFRLGIQEVGNNASRFEAVGNDSTVVINSPVVTPGVVPMFMVRDSIPTFAKVDSSPTLSNTEVTLYQFKVTPDSMGAISFGRLVFDVSESGLDSVDQVKFFRGADQMIPVHDANFASVHNPIYLIWDNGGSSQCFADTAIADPGADDGMNCQDLAMAEWKSKLIVVFPIEETIAANSPQIYTLKATVTGANRRYDSVSASLATGDETAIVADGGSDVSTTGYIYSAPSAASLTSGTLFQTPVDFALNAMSVTNRNIIWSDKSASLIGDGYHAYTTFTAGDPVAGAGPAVTSASISSAFSPDWTNGYLLHIDKLPVNKLEF